MNKTYLNKPFQIIVQKSHNFAGQQEIVRKTGIWESQKAVS